MLSQKVQLDQGIVSRIFRRIAPSLRRRRLDFRVGQIILLESIAFAFAASHAQPRFIHGLFDGFFRGDLCVLFFLRLFDTLFHFLNFLLQHLKLFA